MNTEIDDRQVDVIGDYLKDKKITIGVTGGIAAIEMPKLARQLRRYSAKIRAVMTPSAEKVISLLAMEWGTGNPVVTELSGKSEHLALEDLLVIAPATLNTINKIANGIADNSLTTTAASAMGRGIPVIMAAAMHESLYNNPMLKENIAKLEHYGVKFVQPRGGEGKAKIARNQNIAAECVRTLSESHLKGKKILVTAGPTPGRIDDVRLITNRFKGRLGIEIANEAYLKGADVTLILGSSGIKAPDYINTVAIRDFDEYRMQVFSNLETKCDIGIFSAAVADYVPAQAVEGKIPSKGGLESISLKETPKIIDEVRIKYPDLCMVTFKYECGITRERLEAIAKSRADKYHLVIANRGEDMIHQHNAIIVDKTGVIAEPESKREIAASLIKILEKNYSET